MTEPKRSLKHRGAVGGMWDEIGRLQLDYLVSQGLEPHHRLLDVGCGSMRGGVHFTRFLEPGHYYGIDRNSELLDAGRWELEQAGIADREVHLRQTDAFDIDFGVTFDFALAASVFTHLNLNRIRLCLDQVSRVFAPGGRFYATFFRAGGDVFEPVRRTGEVVTYFHKDPYHYQADDVAWASRRTGLQMQDVGEWGHPRGQEMLLFTKSA